MSLLRYNKHTSQIKPHKYNTVQLTDDVITVIYQFCNVQSIFNLRCINKQFYNVSCQYNEIWLKQHILLIDTETYKHHYTTTLLNIPPTSVQYIKSLHLIGDSINNTWLIAAHRLAKYQALQYLTIHCNCSKYGSIEIQYLPNQVPHNTVQYNKCVSHMILYTLVQSHCHTLKSIDYNYCYRPLPAHLFPQFTALHTLNLDYSDVYDSNLVHIAQIPNLHYLSLEHTRITDSALIWLQNTKSLHWLNLNGTSVRGTGLSNLIHCESLHVLELTETLCDSNAVCNIALKLTSLKVLNIAMTHITIDDSTKLKLCNLTNLTALNVSSRQNAYDDDKLCYELTHTLKQHHLQYYTCNAVHDQSTTQCHNNITSADKSYWYLKSQIQQSIHNCAICQTV